MSIIPFRHTRTDFDDTVTRIMGEAFDAVCAELRDTGQPAIVREVIAKRIREAAAKGERNVTKLRDAGLGALNNSYAKPPVSSDVKT
jgi:hypothetical protein